MSTPLNRFMKPVLIVLGTVLIIAVVVLLVLGWIASSKIMAVARQQITYDQTIQAVNGNEYTISGGAYDVNGLMGGIRSDGTMMGIFGHPTNVDKAATTSVRTLGSPTGTHAKAGDKISLQGNIWTTNPRDALSLDYQDVTYTTPVGAMPAWLIPGADSTIWTIGVHGIGADKTEMLRFIAPVHDAGNTMMIISYRNDAGSPTSPDGRNNLGDTEWQDVAAAVAYARDHGAAKVRLYGDSLGGSLVENYLRRGDNTNLVDRVVLDSPALDWQQILKRRAQSNGYPTIIYYPTAWILRLRTGVSVDRITTHATDIRHTTLIIHSADDPNVPQAASKALAEERPDMITLVDVGRGGHLRSWNYDRARYETLIREFMQVQ